MAATDTSTHDEKPVPPFNQYVQDADALADPKALDVSDKMRYEVILGLEATAARFKRKADKIRRAMNKYRLQRWNIDALCRKVSKFRQLTYKSPVPLRAYAYFNPS